MSTKLFSILTLFVVLLSSCWKEEVPYYLPTSNKDAVQQELILGENYDKIIYFNVNTQEFLVRNFEDWDLAFQAGAKNFNVITNSGKLLKVHETNLTDFEATYAIVDGLVWKYDVPSGNLDSSAFGEWWNGSDGSSKGFMYVVDMTDKYKQGARYKKLLIEKADATGYWIKVGDLNSNTANKSLFIPKDTTRNLAHLNLTTNEVKTDMEPKKDSWDLLFTRYNNIFYDQGPEPVLYQVTGVLLNPNGVIAHKEVNKKFEDIDLNYALSINFSSAQDIIGYDWKSYDQNAGRYTVNSTTTYIIKTVSGYYYKLRFIDFYNTNGIKGSPTFDIQRL